MKLKVKRLCCAGTLLNNAHTVPTGSQPVLYQAGEPAQTCKAVGGWAAHLRPSVH